MGHWAAYHLSSGHIVVSPCAPRKSAAVKNLGSFSFEGRRARRGTPREFRTLLPGFAPIQLDLCIATGARRAPGPVDNAAKETTEKCRSLFWGAIARAASPRPGTAIKDGRAGQGFGCSDVRREIGRKRRRKIGRQGGRMAEGRSWRSARDRASANICHLLSLSPRKHRGV